MLTRTAKTRRTGGRVGNAVLGNWSRTVAVALAVVAAFAIVAGLALGGRVADLRYINIPLVHPWPPSGYVLNSAFDPGNAGDILPAATAAQVKRDLLADGQIELKAVETGDPSILTGYDTGTSLARLTALIQADNAQGIYGTETEHLDSVVVGKLPNPFGTPNAVWCVEERGTGTIRYIARTNGAVVRSSSFRFDDKFWLVYLGGRYAITDSMISNQETGS